MKHFATFFISGMVVLLLVANLSAQWEADVRLTYDDSTSLTALNNGWSIAADGDTVHVVWYDNRDGNNEIYYKRSTDEGINWGTDTRLSIDPDTSYFPSLAVLGTSVHVVWIDDRDGNRELYYKRSLDGGTSWGIDTRLTTDTALSWRPSVAVSGSYVNVVWEDWRGSYVEIYHKRSTDGGSTWEPDFRLSDTLHHSCRPSVAISGNYIHVVWNDCRDGNYETYYKRSTDNGTNWESDLRLSDLPDSSWYCSVAASGNHVHVAWADYRNGNNEIYYKHSSDNGANWNADFRLTDDLASSFVPSITALQSNVHVVWKDDRDGNNEIYYKHSTNYGATWDPDLRLSADDGFRSGNPSITTSGNSVHLIWVDKRDGNYEIYYKRNPTGNAVAEEASNYQFSISNCQLTVYPNPFTTATSITLNLPSRGHSAEGIELTIYDVSGRLVGSFPLTTDHLSLGTDLKPGIYFLKVTGYEPVKVVKLNN